MSWDEQGMRAENDGGAFPFLSGGGHAGRRIAEHDWATTSIGPLSSWPSSLRHTVSLMLRSAVPLVLLWGEDGVMIYNDAYAEFAGGRDSRLLGSKVREGWDEVADFNDNVMKVGLAGRSLSYKGHELTLYRDGRPEQVWLDLDYSPVLDEDGKPAGVIAVVVETTATLRAQRALEISEARLRFLDELGRAVGSCRDADQVLALTTRMTGEHLGISNCAYADMDEDEDGFTIRGDWHAPGSRSIVGHYQLADFGKRAVEELHAGEPLIINDNACELPPHEAQTFRAIGVAATICMPLVKQGRLTALMAIHHDYPREWSDYDLSILRAVTERSWAHVERARSEQQLAERGAQLRRSQEAGGVGLFAIDTLTNVIACTPEFCRIFGFPTVETIPAGEVESLVVPEDTHIVSSIRRRQNGTAPLDVEYRIRRADTGEERLIARKGEYERDADGRIVRLAGAVQDVTERRRIQLALERSEAGFSALAQYMPIQVWTARTDGNLDWFNTRVYEYSGAAQGEIDGDRWSHMVHPDDLSGTLTVWKASLKAGTTYETEFRLRNAAGQYRWHLTRALPLRDSSGIIASWVGTNTDIHEQKMLEMESSRDRDRLWSISRDLLLVCDLSGQITAISPSAERLLGWREDEMIGHDLTEFVHPGDIERSHAEVNRMAAGFTAEGFENRYRTKTGEYRLISWTAVADDARIHAVGRDITDQRAIEDALRQSQKMEAVGQLTGGIAHDFNNLLQGISGSLDVMERRIAAGRTEDLPQWLRAARESAERAAAVTHRLLTFSRRQPIDPRPVEVNPLLASMETLLLRTLGEAIECSLDLERDLWVTKCDANQLESAILNLAINARDAMPDGGRLSISTANVRFEADARTKPRELAAGDYVSIAVADTGIGMSDDVLEHAMEPFFTTKALGQGTGLGLSMVYGFARQSDGFIDIASQPGKGATITLYLPRLAVENTAPAAGPDPVLASTAPANEVVLVVEDEPIIRMLVVDVLEELGYSTLEASDGAKGLEILQSPERIDLLISDIGLPVLNGRQMVDAARVGRPGLKVLFMTGYAETAVQSSGFLEPGMALITKPFQVDALASKIRNIFEE